MERFESSLQNIMKKYWSFIEELSKIPIYTPLPEKAMIIRSFNYVKD